MVCFVCFFKNYFATNIYTYWFVGMSINSVLFCPSCSSVSIELMRLGFFPATPISPSYGFDIQLLKFYANIDITAKSPVAAFTDALVASLEDHGHVFDNREPFLQQVRLLLPFFNSCVRTLRGEDLHQMKPVPRLIRTRTTDMLRNSNPNLVVCMPFPKMGFNQTYSSRQGRV